MKNSSSFDKQDGHSHAKKAKETTFDEMNIIATLHPPDKDYGHMKIDEPKTPFNFSEDELDRLDASDLAEKLKLAADKPPKFKQQSSDDDSDEEDADLTEEEKQKRKEFRQKRKKHYNEFYAVQLARKLLEEDEEEDNESSSKATQSMSSKPTAKGRSPSPSSPKSHRRSSPVGNTHKQGSSKHT